MFKENCSPYAQLDDQFETHFSMQNGACDGFSPSQLTSAYYAVSNGGEGMKIAVVCAFDNVAIESNMETFCEKFGIVKPQMTLFYPDGRNQSLSRNWSIESSLDTQWAHVFAPMAEIYVVFAKNAEVQNLLSASRFASNELGADVVSMSFGREESANDRELSEFFENSNSIFVASSGDVAGRVSFPSTSPHCISVGSTKLVLNANVRIAETACQNGGGGASGVFEIPLWQGRFFNIYGLSNGMRATPDVAMNASETPGALAYDSAQGGWINVSGSSLSCACFAGVCACIKAQNHSIVKTADMLTFLYEKAGTVGYSQPQYSFFDITQGRCGAYSAAKGWDFCTGLGSPKISNLVKNEL